MPRCPRDSRRCPPKTGKCYSRVKKSAAKLSAKSKKPKNNTIKKRSVEKKGVPHKNTMSWRDHLKMCTTRFNITYGAAMSDKRCNNLYHHGHE